MKGAENLEMEPGQSCEDNIYANIHDLKVQRMRDAPTAVEIPPAKNTQHRLLLPLGVLLIFAFFALVTLSSLFFIYYKGIGKEMSQMKNDSLPSDVQNSLGDVRDLEGVQAASSSSNPLCSEGWRHYALSCYYLSSDSKPWNDAKKDCKNKKAHLIVINSEEEMNFLCSIAKGKLLWIGLTDQDGNWTWVDGTPYDTTPKFWGKNQPDDYKGHGFGGGEDCAALRPTNDWNDGHCSRNFPYVCEKKTPL